MNVIDRLNRDNKSIRAAAYARFSSDNQREESIDAQLRAINDYASRNGITVVEEYIDRAKTATTDNRPEFLRMINDSKQKNFNVVLVHKLDRFARNKKDSIMYKFELKRQGVTVVSVTEYLDDESPESIILESMLEAMAEYYSKNLSREVKKGMNETALKGQHTGGKPPLGYQVDKTTKMLVIDPFEAGIVRVIFQRVLDGDGYKQIARYLNENGFCSKNNKPFSANSIHNILINEKYIGNYIFNRAVGKDVDGKRNNHASKSDEDIIRIDGIVPQIISREDFERVATILKSRKHLSAGNKAKEVYLLSGKIECGCCGHHFNGNRKFSGRNKNLHVVYRCGNRDRSRVCKNKDVRREYIEKLVLDQLVEIIYDEKIIPKIVSTFASYQMSQNEEAMRSLRQVESSIRDAAKKIENIIEVMATTASKSLAAKLSELEAEKEEKEKRLCELQKALQMKDVSEKDIIDRFRKARKLFETGELPNMKRLIDLFVDKVVVFEEHVEVFLNVHPDMKMPEYHGGQAEDTLANSSNDYPNKWNNGVMVSSHVNFDTITRFLCGRVCIFFSSWCIFHGAGCIFFLLGASFS